MQADIERVLATKDYPLSAKFIVTQLNKDLDDDNHVDKKAINGALSMMVALGSIEKLTMMPPLYRKV